MLEKRNKTDFLKCVKQEDGTVKCELTTEDISGKIKCSATYARDSDGVAQKLEAVGHPYCLEELDSISKKQLSVKLRTE